MKMEFRAFAAAALLATAALISQPASAVTTATGCLIPPNSDAGGHIFTATLTSAGSIGCYTTGSGNINGNPAQDPLLQSPYNLTFLGGTDSSLFTLHRCIRCNGQWHNRWHVFSGTRSSFASQFGSLVIAFKVGENLVTDWGAFIINVVSGIVTGTWSVSPEQGGGLSHFNVYGGPSAVPLPGALLLLGSVLAGGAGFAGLRRRRQRVVA